MHFSHFAVTCYVIRDVAVAPQMTCLWLLLVLVGTGAGCAPIHETKTSTVLSVTRERAAPVRDSTSDQTNLDLSVRGDDVRVTVNRTVGCVGILQEHRVIEKRTERRVDRGIMVLEGLVTAAGAGLFVYGVTHEFGQDVCSPGEDHGDGCGWGSGFATASGGLIMVPAGIALLIDVAIAATTEGTRTETRTQTVSLPDLDRSPCSTAPAEGSVVTLVFPDGTESAPSHLDAEGHGVIPIDSSAWSRFGETFRVDVRLNDQPIRRSQLSRVTQ